MSSMLSSLAKGQDGQTLIGFAESNKIPEDWHHEDVGVSVILSGYRLDNVNGSSLTVSQQELNDEYLLHLRHRRAKCTLNLATILAMATAFAQQQRELARPRHRVNQSTKRNRRSKRTTR